MHTYLRSVGFKNCQRAQMEKLIEAGISNAVANDTVVYCEDKKKAFVRLECAKGMGISVVCDYCNKDDLQYDFCMPFLITDNHIDVSSVYIEKHSFNDSYGMMTDDIKVNSTIVCTMENAYCHSLNPSDTTEIKKVKLELAAFSISGTILLPVEKQYVHSDVREEHRKQRREYQLAARAGDEEAMELLALEDIDTYNSIVRRSTYEDLYSIVESTFIPCGVECDTYSVMGEILSVREVVNSITKQQVYLMSVECNDIFFDVAINKEDLLGEPQVGRRFKGHVWLSGRVLN